MRLPVGWASSAALIAAAIRLIMIIFISMPSAVHPLTKNLFKRSDPLVTWFGGAIEVNETSGELMVHQIAQGQKALSVQNIWHMRWHVEMSPTTLTSKKEAAAGPAVDMYHLTVRRPSGRRQLICGKKMQDKKAIKIRKDWWRNRRKKECQWHKTVIKRSRAKRKRRRRRHRAHAIRTESAIPTGEPIKGHVRPTRRRRHGRQGKRSIKIRLRNLELDSYFTTTHMGKVFLSDVKSKWNMMAQPNQ